MARTTAPPAIEDVILDAAEERFARDGVRRTTIDDIAQDAGVSRITVYRRVGGRDDIVLAVLLRITDRHLARLRPRLLARPDLESALVLLVHSTMLAARRDDLSLLFGSEEHGVVGAPLPGALEPLAARFGWTVAALDERFPGQLDPVVDVTEAGEWLLRVVVSLATFESTERRAALANERFIRRFAVGGLLARPSID